MALRALCRRRFPVAVHCRSRYPFLDLCVYQQIISGTMKGNQSEFNTVQFISHQPDENLLNLLNLFNLLKLKKIQRMN
jgi:hypothetical protein